MISNELPTLADLYDFNNLNYCMKDATQYGNFSDTPINITGDCKGKSGS